MEIQQIIIAQEQGQSPDVSGSRYCNNLENSASEEITIEIESEGSESPLCDLLRKNYEDLVKILTFSLENQDIPMEDLKQFYDDLLTLLRQIQVIQIFMGIFQCIETNGEKNKYELTSFIIWHIIRVLWLAMSYWLNKKEFVYPIMIFDQIMRVVFSVFVTYKEQRTAFIFLMINNSIISMIFSPKVFVPMSLSVIIVRAVSNTLGRKDEEIPHEYAYDLQIENFSDIMIWIIFQYIFHSFFQHFKLLYYQVFLQNQRVLEEFEHILENLEEAIITVTSEVRLGFCNHIGFQIIKDIQGESENEDIILSKKVFKLHQNLSNQQNSQSEQKNSSRSASDVPIYSFLDLFEMKQSELECKVFQPLINHHIFQQPNSVHEFKHNQQFLYVMIKIPQSQQSKNKVLQIIDISDQILYDVVNAEKKLLALINATVSHEMRNPVNSIYSQNILQKQLNNQMSEVLKKGSYHQLQFIHKQYCDSVKIQASSTKLLTFLVNDILDFGQLKAGKFRKDCINFNLMEATEEIILILQYKAEMYGINIKTQFENFPSAISHDKITINYTVISDMQRYQQILLNILSNALKFSQSQDTVFIRCRLIKNEDDLSDKERNKHLLQKAKNGMIEIAVTDEGIGIKTEDQDKLFKLFGFLDRTKDINTKGVGLGLHISKMIVEQLGGEIQCQSEWLKGSTFTYLIALGEIMESQLQIQRWRNPVIKTYPKMRMVKQFDDDNLDKEQKLKLIQETVFERVDPKNLAKEMHNGELQKSFNEVKEDFCKVILTRSHETENLETERMSYRINEEEICQTMKSEEKKYEPFDPSPNKRTFTFKDQTNLIAIEIPESDFIDNYVKMPTNVIIKETQINNFDNRVQSCISYKSYQKSMTYLEPSNQLTRQDSPLKRLLSLDNDAQRLEMDNINKRQKMMQNKRILIVDDEPYNILGLKILLPQVSNINILHYIDEAKNGQDALNLITAAYNSGQYSYGLIFMDCNMPIMDGFEATDYIRNFITSRDIQQPKIIACTGHTDEEYIERCWCHHMDEFLMKPTNIEVLKTIINESIQFIE